MSILNVFTVRIYKKIYTKMLSNLLLEITKFQTISTYLENVSNKRAEYIELGMTALQDG